MAVELTQCVNTLCARQFEYERISRAFYQWGESGLLSCPYCGAIRRLNADFFYLARPLPVAATAPTTLHAPEKVNGNLRFRQGRLK